MIVKFADQFYPHKLSILMSLICTRANNSHVMLIIKYCHRKLSKGGNKAKRGLRTFRGHPLSTFFSSLEPLGKKTTIKWQKRTNHSERALSETPFFSFLTTSRKTSWNVYVFISTDHKIRLRRSKTFAQRVNRTQFKRGK